LPKVVKIALGNIAPGMGLAPGGRMKQEIHEDPFGFADWDRNINSRCFIHLTNSLVWRSMTGEKPPTAPFTSKEYSRAGLPWFDYYDDNAKSIEGSGVLNNLKSITELGGVKGDTPLPENESVIIDKIVKLRKNMSEHQVRDGEF